MKIVDEKDRYVPRKVIKVDFKFKTRDDRLSTLVFRGRKGRRAKRL